MTIPKKIHYIWVGGSEMPPKIAKMISDNKKILGDEWEINIWTEKDFDINANLFTKHWYRKQNWAFVSDYIRAYMVNKHGGFYLDTDIKLSQSLDELTKYSYVASRTGVTENTMSIFGSTKNSKVLKLYMDIISMEKMIPKPPRIMSTHIHTYALRQFLKIPDSNTNYFKDGYAIFKEDRLQIKINKNNIAIHEHHDNWKGTSNLNKSKYYYKKVKEFEHLSNKKILKSIKARDKMMDKINKITNFQFSFNNLI